MGYRSLALAVAVVCGVASGCMHRSPVTRHDSVQGPLSGSELRLRDELVRDVEALAAGIGPRHAARSIDAVIGAERWITERLRESGVEPQRDEIDLAGTSVANVVATLPGTSRPDEWRGYPAIALSDTSEFRNPHYHRPTDTPETLDYDAMARMGEGFIRTVRRLANAASAGRPVPVPDQSSSNQAAIDLEPAGSSTGVAPSGTARFDN